MFDPYKKYNAFSFTKILDENQCLYVRVIRIIVWEIELDGL